MCKSPQAKSMSACTVPQLDGTPAAWTSRRWRHTGWGGVIFGAPVSPCQSLHPTLTGPGCVMVHMPHARLTSVSLLEGNCARMEPVCSSNLCNGVEVVAEKRLDGRGGPVARRLATHRLAKLINSCKKLRRCVTRFGLRRKNNTGTNPHPNTICRLRHLAHTSICLLHPAPQMCAPQPAALAGTYTHSGHFQEQRPSTTSSCLTQGRRFANARQR